MSPLSSTTPSRSSKATGAPSSSRGCPVGQQSLQPSAMFFPLASESGAIPMIDLLQNVHSQEERGRATDYHIVNSWNGGAPRNPNVPRSPQEVYRKVSSILQSAMDIVGDEFQ